MSTVGIKNPQSTVEVHPEYVSAIVGLADQNIRVLEERLDADIFLRGNIFSLFGEEHDIRRAADTIKELESMARRGQAISPDIALHALNLIDSSQGYAAASSSEEKPQYRITQGHSQSRDRESSRHHSHHSDSGIISRRGKQIRPKTLGQHDYVDAIDENTIIFGLGPAGTGKTYLAMAKAVQALQNKEVRRIILTRPAVEAGEKLGFLPGTLGEKIDPYLRPLHDALRDMVDPEQIPEMMESGIIEVAPLAYMRGRTLNNAFIILDEAQNTTPAQMKMFLTRLGFGSKMVVTGDLSQVDLPGKQESGLHTAQKILDTITDIAVIHLGDEDVVRHHLIGRIVAAYDSYEREE